MSVFFGYIDKVKEEDWKTILLFNVVDQGESSEDDEEFLADQSMISTLRERLFTSSPVKA